MDLDLPRLRAFVVAADQLSFTRAAELLGIAQPSLSERIRRLEHELGVELFSRQRRQVSLTPAGEELLRRARLLLAAADETITAVDALRRPEPAERRLALATLAASIDELKAGILVELRNKAPDLTVTLTPVPFSAHLRVLHDGRADAAFIWPPYATAALAGLHVEPVREFPRLLAVHARHPLARACPIDVVTLRGFPQIPLTADVDPTFTATWRLVPNPPLAAVNPVDTVSALLDAVAAGHGCSPVPALLAHTTTRTDLAFVPFTNAEPASLALAWRRDTTARRHTMLTRAASTLR